MYVVVEVGRQSRREGGGIRTLVMRFSDDIVGDVGWRVLCVIVYRCVESRNRTKSTQIGDLVVKDQLRAILAGDTGGRYWLLSCTYLYKVTSW